MFIGTGQLTDAKLISDALINFGVENGLEEEVDEMIDGLNARLHAKLTPAKRLFEVEIETKAEVTCYASVFILARSEDDARRQVEEKGSSDPSSLVDNDVIIDNIDSADIDITYVGLS